MSTFREPAENLNTGSDVQVKVSEQAAQAIRARHQFVINHRAAADGILWIECPCRTWTARVPKGSMTQGQMFDLHQQHVTDDVNELGPLLTQQSESCERILGGPKGRELFARIQALPNPTSNGESR